MPIDREETLRRIEKLVRQGRLDAAIAEYVRVVEEHPRDWATANALGDLYVRMGQAHKAAEQYGRIAHHFFTEGFIPRAIALYKKVLKIRPDDEDALLRLAEASARQELLADAKTYFMSVVNLRRRRGDDRGANGVVVRLAALDPADLDAKLDAARALIALGDAAGAGTSLREVAGELRARGRDAEAREALREAVRLDPSDRAGRTALARACLDVGDVAGAREYVQRGSDDDDPGLLLELAGAELRQGHVDDGRDAIRRVLQRDASQRDQVVALGMDLAVRDPDTALAILEVVADVDAEKGNWTSAAGVLQALAGRRPEDVAPILKLVEICVDGGLEDTMYLAQAQLTDAYLASGRAAEARLMAEDLMACEPWDTAHVDRFRRALVMLGEVDPDAVVTDRIGRPAVLLQPVRLADDRAVAPSREVPVEDDATPARSDTAAPAEAPVDVTALLREAEALEGVAATEPVEVDLTAALEALQRGAVPAEPAGSLDDVFQEIRDDLGRHAAEEEAEEQWKLAQTCREMGMMEEAIAALRAAARSPRRRFQAAAQLGRLYRERGLTAEAIEWFERAAEAPAATPADSQALLYDLGDTLEHAGETARALAVFLELAADAGRVRDVQKRIDRLSRVQTGG